MGMPIYSYCPGIYMEMRKATANAAIITAMDISLFHHIS
jgi:hypothetical protein